MTLLKGLVSLVTGGASGLGRATVKYLSKHGGSVILCDLPESKGEEVAKSIGGNTVFSPCDVSSEEDVQCMMNLCSEKFGRLDLAVNCAGMARAFMIANPVTNKVMELESLEILFKSHVYGTFNVTRLAAQLMHRNEPNSDGQRGVIINTGSLSSEHGLYGQSGFAAAKGAIAAMTLPIARDLSTSGIRVVTISPGLFETPLTSEDCISPGVRSYMKDQCLFPRRFGYPDEFAKMVESVVMNPMLNAENIRLNGGLRFFFVDM